MTDTKTHAAAATEAVLQERQKQNEKWGEQNHDMMTWLAILHEETGELAEACLHKKFGGPEAGNILHEAIQVAAVALQIVEFLLRTAAAPTALPEGMTTDQRIHAVAQTLLISSGLTSGTCVALARKIVAKLEEKEAR